MPLRSFAAVLAALVVFSADAGAQTPAADAEGAQVTGAAGFTWGSTRADIVARRGAAAMEQPDAERVAAPLRKTDARF